MVIQRWRVWRAGVVGSSASVQRLVRFGLVGAGGVGVNMAIFWLLLSRLHVHYLLASPPANEAAICANYVLNNQWTFADRGARLGLAGLARYHAVAFGGILVNVAMLRLLSGGLGTPPLLANLAGIGVATGWNYALNVCWTWRLRPGATEPTPATGIEPAVEVAF